MTLERESERSLMRAEQLLIDLLSYPRVPQAVREEARSILRHYPSYGEDRRRKHAVYPLRKDQP